MNTHHNLKYWSWMGALSASLLFLGANYLAAVPVNPLRNNLRLPSF